MKLLIVDDNKKMRKVIKDIFCTEFASIHECEDGLYAAEKYGHYKPDWVFMDILMDKVDGIEATKNIMRLYPEAKIIIVTDFNDEGIKKISHEAGACAFVLKENLEELFEIIKK